MSARVCLPLLLAAALAGAVQAQPRLAAVVTDERLSEISGMAASPRHPDLLWVHNDSRDAARLFAVDRQGSLRASLLLRGASNTDWEDMAAFELDGRSWLLVADTGDNGGIRDTLTLLVVEEPASPAHDQQAEPAWQVRFRWPDGPRDCEAVAVDPAAGLVYLVAKKRVPPELWQVPLRPATDALVDAVRVGTLSGVDQPSTADLERNPVYGRYRSQITGADLAADGSALAVLNYRTAYLYRRRPGEPWARAIARAPLELPFPWLPQAEAIALERDGRSAWVSSEKLPAPLLQLPIP